MEIIRSKTNGFIKQAKKLHQKKYRKNSYLIEGWHLLEEAIRSKAKIEGVFVEEAFVDRVKDLDQVRCVTREVLVDLADSQHPQGVVAQIAYEPSQVPAQLRGRYLVLEDVQDPGNLGTMIRTADAAGYEGVFLSDKSADSYSLKVLRSMQGSHFHLPIYRLPMTEIVEVLQKAGIPLWATTLSQNSVDYRSLEKPSSFALVMGNEGQGISEQVVQEANQLVHISMPGQAESLNVAVAAGILLFHFI